MSQYRTIWVLRGDLSLDDERGLVKTAEEDSGASSLWNKLGLEMTVSVR